MSTTETREIVLRDNSGTVTVREEFAQRFPALAPTPEMMEIFQENLDGEELDVGDFRRIKVPSGELKSWVVTQGGEEMSVRELVGVIVAIKARRSFWDSDNPDGSQPDCASADNKVPQPGGWFAKDGPMGAQNPRGLCKTCPMFQRGSGENGASRCREQRLLFLMTSGAMFPVVVHVPRTSVRGVKGYAMELAEATLPYFAVETGLVLEQASNKQGQAYNKIKLRSLGKLTEDEVTAAKVYGIQIKEMIDAAAADFSETGTTEAAGDGISVGEPTGS